MKRPPGEEEEEGGDMKRPGRKELLTWCNGTHSYVVLGQVPGYR